MSQISSPGILLKNSVEAVITPLEDGIISLTRVYESLIDTDLESISTNYTSIRQLIVQSHQSLEHSEQTANAGLNGLDEHFERLTADQGKLEQEMRETECTLDNLRIEKMSNEKLLRDSKNALEQVRKNMTSADETLRNQENWRRNAEIVTEVGKGLFQIPVVGWISGAAMVADGVVEMDQASHAIRVAEEEVKESESEVEKYRRKVSDYQSKISQLEHNIKQKHDEVEHIHKEIQQVRQKREGIGEIQVKVRRAIHLLNDLSGKTRVAECHTRRFIHQKLVMNMMEEVMKAAEGITGNELLFSEDIPQLLNTMKESHQRLAAICASRSKTEEDNYY